MGANFCFRLGDCTSEVGSSSGHENLLVFNNLELRQGCPFSGVPLIVSLDSSGFEYLKVLVLTHTAHWAIQKSWVRITGCEEKGL
jgi:hypothetical protein